jgi:hypothetical protein
MMRLITPTKPRRALHHFAPAHRWNRPSHSSSAYALHCHLLSHPDEHVPAYCHWPGPASMGCSSLVCSWQNIVAAELWRTSGGGRQRAPPWQARARSTRGRCGRARDGRRRGRKAQGGHMRGGKAWARTISRSVARRGMLTCGRYRCTSPGGELSVHVGDPRRRLVLHGRASTLGFGNAT